ncbi:hypothetical protein OBBRIDRAFT_782023 [Obba rivulosa]|uniref:Uncharacterized protein n=1 Tax=Obba rivulosa TaxID=1052685 RepID=A0A8E2ASJ7_9APHY|nr:hypothetical protein OBBRIDRAFT_782023 [Obba rivulosa]
MADHTPYSVEYLREELILRPIIVSTGSLNLSIFMSHLVFDVLDWRPVMICITSDILAVGMDHYFDYGSSLVFARAAGDAAMMSTFAQARILLVFSTVLFIVALSCSPLLTWVAVATFFGPAFLWDVDLVQLFCRLNVKYLDKSYVKKPNDRTKLSIKRIPWIKALLDGVIRGCGTFAVVYSILASTAPARVYADWQMWTASEIIVWSTLNRACHSVMTDIRDFREDSEGRVPTIPVLLGSVRRAKVLLTIIHLFTLWIYIRNPYIVFASLYATVLVWILTPITPRRFYQLSFQSQTLVILMYYIVRLAPLPVAESVHSHRL